MATHVAAVNNSSPSPCILANLTAGQLTRPAFHSIFLGLKALSDPALTRRQAAAERVVAGDRLPRFRLRLRQQRYISANGPHPRAGP